MATEPSALQEALWVLQKHLVRLRVEQVQPEMQRTSYHNLLYVGQMRIVSDL